MATDRNKKFRIAFLTADWNYELVESTLHGLTQYTVDHPDVQIRVFDCFGKDQGNANDRSEYAIFDLADLSRFDGVLVQGNLYQVNATPGQDVQVDPYLYQTLQQVEESGTRALYLAPVYEYYKSLFQCSDDASAQLVDPAFDADAAEDIRNLCAFINDPEAIRLEFPAENTVRLEVSDAYKAYAEESGVSYAILSGIQKIKLSGAEKRAFAKWAKIYASGAEIEFNPPLFLKINSAITLAVSLFGTVLLYYLAATSGVSPSAYIAFTAAYGTVTGAFTAFSSIATSAAQIKPILEMAEPILQTEPETAEGREIVTKLSGSIELSNISFRYYDTQPYVINGLNLKIKAGEYVAIVGKTGCGKSTLLRLLLGFETPEKGAIYYDRKDLRSLDLGSLRRRMGVVTQDGSLFHGDIFSNITVSSPQLTIDDAWEAAEKAGIAEDIRAMPMGMHTFLSEGQGGVSGGQRQRLMIARAIAPKPKILLFDEATSALDNKTQKQVADALAELNCTRVVIAHRLSTVKDCDRIVVLDGGKIIEEGTYDALIAKGGFFAELVERQRID